MYLVYMYVQARAKALNSANKKNQFHKMMPVMICDKRIIWDNFGKSSLISMNSKCGVVSTIQFPLNGDQI